MTVKLKIFIEIHTSTGGRRKTNLTIFPVEDYIKSFHDYSTNHGTWIKTEVLN